MDSEAAREKLENFTYSLAKYSAIFVLVGYYYQFYDGVIVKLGK